MCGIAGIYKFKAAVDIAQLKQMTDILAHRGPDGEGQWVEGNIGLGHRRLSIIDLSNHAAQPMLAVDNRYSITFNGEIYNYLELKEQLLKKGANFETQSDTEVLIWAFHFYKEKCLDLLDGMFAFAIWDKVEKKLFAARDRFGEKPFYYHHSSQEFVFASEIKAIWEFGVTKEIKEQAFYNYWVYDILENPLNLNETFFKNISQLPPAHYLVIDELFNIKISQYWDINLQNISNDNEEFAANRINDLLLDSVEKRLRADVPVGSSLSGGLDSSIIVEIINSEKPANLVQNTFSARFHSAKDEGEYIDKVLKGKNVVRNDVWVESNDLIENLDQIIWHHDEPVSSGSVIAQWKVMELAKKENVTVLLDGQGADEVFAGYEYFYRKFFGQLLKQNKKQYYKALQQYYQTYPNGNGFKPNFLFFIQTYFPEIISKCKWFADKHQFTMESKSLSASFVSQNAIGSNPYKHFFNLNQDLYEATCRGKMLHLLRLADRNSMAHSREVRLPYLSHSLVEYAFSLPAEMKISDGYTKSILRKSMQGKLNDDILWRKNKIGFEAPQNDWLAHPEILERINNSINALLSAGFVAKKKVSDYTDREQWKLLVMEKMI